MYDKKISVNDIQYLFDRLAPINFFIKSESGVLSTSLGKSAFYTIKSHIILYVLNAIKHNYYQIDKIEKGINVSYEVTGLEYIETQPHNYVQLKFIIGNKEYKFHQVVKGKLATLLEKELPETMAEYQQPASNLYNAKTYPNRVLKEMWKDIINKLAELSWNVYHFTDIATWADIMMHRYNGIKILTCDNRWQKNSLGFIRVGNRKTGTRTRTVNFKYMKQHLPLMLANYFPDDNFLNYYLKD